MDPFRLFTFETAIDTSVDGSASSEVEAGAEGVSEVGDGAASPTPEAPAAPTPTPGTLTAEQAAQIADERFAALLEQFGGQETEPEFDPFDPDSFKTLLEHRDKQLLEKFQEMMAPVRSFADEQIDQRGREAIRETVNGWKDELGEFDDDQFDTIEAIGNSLVMQAGPRATPEYGQQALRYAAERVSSLVKAAESRGVERYKQSLTSDGSTLLEPGVGGNALPGGDIQGDELAVARAFMQRRNV